MGDDLTVEITTPEPERAWLNSYDVSVTLRARGSSPVILLADTLAALSRVGFEVQAVTLASCDLAET